MEENEAIVGLDEEVYEYEGDVILEGYCNECAKKLVPLIKYVRNLESAQVVAKESLDTLVMTCEKLQEELDKEKQRNKALLQQDIKKKMEDFDRLEQQMVNRKKLGVE